tara:strand:+ start:6708 stop:7082 length:375 start_codon:yes stop_codon:yes gene_type:complete
MAAKGPLRNMLLRLLGKSKNVTTNVPTGPIKGSLDESFQKFVIKNNMLNQKGFFGPGGYRGGVDNFQKRIDQLKLNTKPKMTLEEYQRSIDNLRLPDNPPNSGKQLDLFKDKKKGGSVGPNGVL